MADYVYSVATDFTSLDVAGVVNLELLRIEIGDSAIASGLPLTEILIEDDAVTISFTGTLTSGDETILDGVVAAHTGTWPGSEAGEGPLNFYEEAATNSPSTTSASYVDVPSMVVDNVQAGKWLALFSTTLTHDDDNGVAQLAIAVNGVVDTASQRLVTIRHSGINYNFFTQAFLQLVDGDSVAVRYRTGEAGKFAQVFERNFILVRLD